jgi:hypothetical protein
MKKPVISHRLLSGWQDSNLRPPGPKPGAMTGLRYIPNRPKPILFVRCAVRAGFEPAVQFPVRQFSKLVVSASHPPHRGRLQMYKKYLLPKTSMKIIVFCLIYRELVFSSHVKIPDHCSKFAPKSRKWPTKNSFWYVTTMESPHRASEILSR